MCHSIALPFSISYSVSSGLLWQFIALYSSSSSLTLSFALAVALADSHSHSHSRSFTCLLVQLAYSPFLKWFCLIATLSFTRIFFLFSASISIPNRIPMSKKDHMNRMNCHWMTHTNAKTVTYALANRIVWQFNF